MGLFSPHVTWAPLRKTRCNTIIGNIPIFYLTLHLQFCYARGFPKTPEFIYKILCIYSYMFKLQSPSKYCPFDVIRLSRNFSHYSDQFFNLLILMPFCTFAFFVSPLPHWQNVPLWGLFHRRNKIVAQGESRWIGRVGHQGHDLFGQKPLGRCTCKSPIMKWANALSLQKTIQWSQTQPLTTMPVGTLIQRDS